MFGNCKKTRVVKHGPSRYAKTGSKAKVQIRLHRIRFSPTNEFAFYDLWSSIWAWCSHCGIQSGLYEWNTDHGSRCVILIFLRKELPETFFLVANPSLEESPRCASKYNNLDWITQQKLRTNGPVEKTNIRRMSKVFVSASKNKNAVFSRC